MRGIFSVFSNLFKSGNISGRLESKYQNVFEFLKNTNSIVLKDYQVVGNCYRYDTVILAEMRDLVDSIGEMFSNWVPGSHNNFLIWSRPGLGKSFLAKEIGNELNRKDDSIQHLGIDLRNIESKTKLISSINLCEKALDDKKKVLAYIDEVDCSIEGQPPFENLFGPADWSKNKPIVWLYMGSSGEDLEDFKGGISACFKGTDFLSRVPNIVQISPLTPGDKVIIAAALGFKNNFVKFKRSALMTFAMHQKIQITRDIEQCISLARRRLARNEFYYTDVFALESKAIEFYKQNEDMLRELDYNVRIKND